MTRIRRVVASVLCGLTVGCGSIPRRGTNEPAVLVAPLATAVVPADREAFEAFASMDWPRAAALLATLDDADPLVERSLALALYHSGRIPEAIEVFEDRRTAGRVDSGELEILAAYYEGQGRPDAAEAALRSVLTIEPTNDKALSQLGQLLLHGPDPRRARPVFEQLYTMDATDYYRILLVGIARREDGDDAAAAAASDELVRLFPDRAEAWRERAWNLLSVDLAAAALDANDAALALDENDPATWSQRGTILVALGRPAEAFEASAMSKSLPTKGTP